MALTAKQAENAKPKDKPHKNTGALIIALAANVKP